MKGLVIKSTGSWYEVQVEDGTIYKARLRGKFKLNEAKVTNPIAVGDQVALEQKQAGEDYYVITELYDRKNYVIRKSPKRTAHAHIIASNVDIVVIIATFKQPRTSLGFIDRVLVTAESYRIPCLIVFNKSDLLEDQDHEELAYICYDYDQIGYQNMLVSALEGKGIANLAAQLAGKVALFTGHSGTGKSTLINLLVGDADQKTSEISSFANKGVHTTTFAEMFPTKENGFIVDTPGIKELGLIEIEDEELSHYFPEMRKYLGSCKFNNCQHISEPGCQILAAVESGEIPATRFESYLSMLTNDDNRR